MMSSSRSWAACRKGHDGRPSECVGRAGRSAWPRCSDATTCFSHLTEHESCSNALIEAINCGLPAIYLHSGANEEVARDYGVRWEVGLDEALDRLLPRYGEIVERIPQNPYRISLVARRYRDVLEAVAAGAAPLATAVA